MNNDWLNKPLFAFTLIFFAILSSAGCTSPRKMLGDYYSYSASPRQNFPADYISFLKQTRFKNGELDGLPSLAIIFYGDVDESLNKLGYSQYTVLRIGTSTPSTLTVVRTKEHSFMVAAGMPGAGGITTISSELLALGAKRLIHIGTCASLQKEIDGTQVILASGSYKDGAAVLLSPKQLSKSLIADADANVSQALYAQLTKDRISNRKGLGFTTPIYYWEPTDLYKRLSMGAPPYSRCDYIEMEQAPFFITCKLMNAAGASMVVPGDQYTFSGGSTKHIFLNAEVRDRLLNAALEAAITIAGPE